MRIRNAISWVILILLFVTSFFVITRMQEIRDWFALRNYSPSARVEALANDTSMKPATRQIFYVNHPSLEQKSSFNGVCRETEQSIVLGCYISNRGIFLLDVDDERLAGVIEVTAAHEVLHAQYDRLSAKERNKIDKMTAEFFATVKDERIKKTIENYRKKDASIVPNELHSILASEVRDLSPDLEKYYAQYFFDRKRIVNFSEQYEQTFINLENKVEKLDEQLNSIKIQIDNNQAQLNTKSNGLDMERAELNRLRQDNDIDGYNRKVVVFNQLVGSYNSLINSTKQLINNYNSLLEERNSVALQEQDLIESIDSTNLKEQ